LRVIGFVGLRLGGWEAGMLGGSKVLQSFSIPAFRLSGFPASNFIGPSSYSNNE
jgi:hypothetical protein